MGILFCNRVKIRSTRRAEAEREKYCRDREFFTALESGGKPASLEQLGNRVQSPEFRQKRKALRRFSWCLPKARRRWVESEERKLWKAYKRLKKERDLKRYSALKRDPVFNAYRRWELTFEDTFKGSEPDGDKWIFRYYAGEYLLRDTYGVGQDVQLFRPGNVSTGEKGLVLEFRKETVDGKYWDSRRGIVARKFDYTSGMVNTALSFRQYLGRFEAKIRVGAGDAEPCFWLAGEGVWPHVNIMKFSKNGFGTGVYTDHRNRETGKGNRRKMKLRPGEYIFSLDWTKEELVWKINDGIVRKVKNTLPQQPLFAGISLGSVREIPESRLPQRVTVEWVRIYREVNPGQV